jgi:hypothetical protein
MLSAAVPAIKRAPFTPPATADNYPVVFRYEVSPIANELPVNAKDRSQCCFDLSL